MRVFLCSYDEFTMAIPIASISSITIFRGKAEKEIEHSNENIYISLPLVLGCNEGKIKHGIIIKNSANPENGAFREKCFILLTTEIECETEISDLQIFPSPKMLNVTKFSQCFSSIIFNTVNNKGGLILLLDPLHLIKNIQKELTI